jgi:hypothetical protein
MNPIFWNPFVIALFLLLFRMVERLDLPALEFLMSKQPRGRVRVSEGNTVGAPVPNVFVEVDKFQKRFQEMKQKSVTR